MDTKIQRNKQTEREGVTKTDAESERVIEIQREEPRQRKINIEIQILSVRDK
jgi:hypothetical protein